MASAPSRPHLAPVMSILFLDDVQAGSLNDPGGDRPAVAERGGVVQVVLLVIQVAGRARRRQARSAAG